MIVSWTVYSSSVEKKPVFMFMHEALETMEII